jgi:hypothetical protein
MKALVYHGPGQKAWEQVPDPKIIHPTDAYDTFGRAAETKALKVAITG